ncbi:MAG: hypothetical protein K2O02_04680 [Lachnospiraceae bacterium]|nr:hypothetical protein [Lachnospiraceae bacterium]
MWNWAIPGLGETVYFYMFIAGSLLAITFEFITANIMSRMFGFVWWHDSCPGWKDYGSYIERILCVRFYILPEEGETGRYGIG